MTRADDPLSRAALLGALRALSPEPEATRVAAEVERLVHDLEVHQIELELQNRELRVAQQQLEESRSRYADLFDLAPVGYCSLDEDGRVRELNLTAAGMLGIDRARLHPEQLMALLSQPDRERARRHLHECFSEGGTPTTELNLRVTGRGPLVVQMESTPMFGIGGRVLATRTTLTDVSELRRAERVQRFTSEASEALASSLDYEKTLANVAQLAVPLLADICFVDLVDKQEGMRRLEIAFADEAKAPLAEALKHAYPTADPNSIQVRVLRSRAPTLVSDPDEARAAADLGAAGPARSVMCIPLVVRDRPLGTMTLIVVESQRVYSTKDLDLALDIGRRAAVAIDHARLYGLAQQATRTRDEVLAVIAHDLKSPLGLITLGASTMLNRAPEADRRASRRQLEDIQRGAERMALLIDDLVKVRSLEAGGLSLSLSPLPVRALLADTAALLRPLSQRAGIELRVEDDPSGACVLCDRERTLQVLSNLVENALKFTRAGGRVVVSARPDGSMVKFSVSDTGSGIDPALLPHVFERYFSGQDEPAHGSGLGLHIANIMVQAQDGQIWVTSTPGEGSVFNFTLPAVMSEPTLLPLAQDAPAPAQTAPPIVHEPREAAIMIVDEDPEIREALAELLSHAGHPVIIAASAEEACEHIQPGREGPALLLFDPLVRNLDHAVAVERLQHLARARNVPIVLLSRRHDLESQAEALGAVASMKKPLQLGRLLRLVQAHRS